MKITVTAILMALVVAACGGQSGGDSADTPSSTPVENPVITIADMEFQNGSITVEAGTTVTWVWEDAPMQHNVVFDDVESPLQAEGTWTHTFEEPGSFDYHCAPHPFMKGTITVVEAAGNTDA